MGFFNNLLQGNRGRYTRHMSTHHAGQDAGILAEGRKQQAALGGGFKISKPGRHFIETDKG
jgi:hypothetical protein